jgi:hypothetical protein
VRRRYHIQAEVTISVSCEVQASSPEEARHKASELPLIGLCHYCASGEPTKEWVTSGELDGTPRSFEVDEI